MICGLTGLGVRRDDEADKFAVIMKTQNEDIFARTMAYRMFDPLNPDTARVLTGHELAQEKLMWLSVLNVINVEEQDTPLGGFDFEQEWGTLNATIRSIASLFADTKWESLDESTMKEFLTWTPNSRGMLAAWQGLSPSFILGFGGSWPSRSSMSSAQKLCGRRHTIRLIKTYKTPFSVCAHYSSSSTHYEQLAQVHFLI